MWAKSFLIFFFKFQDGPDAGKDEQVKVHTRSIGDKSYTVKRVTSNEVTEEEVVEGNNWTSDEKLAFIEDWVKNWNPSYHESGISAKQLILNLCQMCKSLPCKSQCFKRM